MDDFNNKYENENKNAETPVNETPAEPQAQQPNETAPQQTETPQAQQQPQSGEEPRTPFQTPVQHPEYQSPRERSNAQQFQSSQQPPVQQTPQQQNGIPYSDAWHQQNQQSAMPHRSRKSGRRLVIGLCSVAAACLLFAGGAVATYFVTGSSQTDSSASASTDSGSTPTMQINSKPSDSSSSSSDGMSGEDIYKKVSPSVVSVISTTSEGQGSGSGVIMSSDGYIITNNHVVEGGSAYEVMVAGETYEADLVGTDPSSDVAVLKAKDASGLTVMELGDSDNLTIGEWVMTLGSPFGLEQSVATGIVSATSRSQIMDAQESMQSGGTGEITIYPNMIQTDAAINPGNSGGALVDDEGKLIGINTLITSYSGNYSGVGFAIPVNYAINLAQQIIAGETPTHAQLGVSLSTVSAATASRYGLPVDAGAYVAAVTPDSGAAAAGIVPGDIVTAFDGQAVESASDLMLDVRTKNPGDTVTLTVNSGGQEKEVQVTLGDDSASQKAKQEQQSQEQSMNGYSLEDLFGRQR